MAFDDFDIIEVHRSIAEYAPTPLHDLGELTSELGIGRIFLKDESQRFGLKAFKALGATYAVYRFLQNEFKNSTVKIPSAPEFYRKTDWLEPGRFTFTTATDGNHGRGVAWVAKKLRQKAVIYMPDNSVPARIDNIRKENAEVILVEGGYDRAVQRCREDAAKNDWQIISDTSWEGYVQIPKWIQAGYSTMFREIDEQIGPKTIDLAIMQGGVGALLAAAARHLNEHHPGIRIVCIEPLAADCLLRSAASPDGMPVSISGSPETIMAGLNCGTPSDIAWPDIRKGVDLFIAIPDNYVCSAMRKLYITNPCIVSGESGAAGFASLLALKQDARLQGALGLLNLGMDSNILLINTEGDTDPYSFLKIINGED